MSLQAHTTQLTVVGNLSVTGNKDYLLHKMPEDAIVGKSKLFFFLVTNITLRVITNLY